MIHETIKPEHINFFGFRKKPNAGTFIQYKRTDKSLLAIKLTRRGLSQVSIKINKANKLGIFYFGQVHALGVIRDTCTALQDKKTTQQIRELLFRLHALLSQLHIAEESGEVGRKPDSVDPSPADSPEPEQISQAGAS